ncbi:MAG: 4-alpha-glucanotransferase [Treponema sp.]|nr:4-alpha-glucanotransferase [Treponema sp.]
MKYQRQSGVLLHPTSLPGTPGIGTLGIFAYKFIDWLEAADQTLWQILPLGPTGYGDSPYASFSTFAGNPLLIDFDLLVEKGWALKKDVIPPEYIKSDGNVDFGAVVWWKTPVLIKCAEYFKNAASKEDMDLYKSFCKDKNKWLDNYALFMSIKQFYDKKAAEEKPVSSMWNVYWPKELASHDETALAEWKKSHKNEIENLKIIQFFFDYQWTQLKEYANKKNISLIGDIPIFVAPDSADVWANQNLFQLDENGCPKAVAGVPPDYFCADGQLWGNPLYDWEKMKETGYAWWIARIKRVLELTDILRIDHFRGFEAYWSVPFGEKTVINGKWIKGPGIDLFKTIKRKLGELPIIAEDLGVITDEVAALRDESGFPGMKVLQFAFSTDEIKANGYTNYFLPHMFEKRECVVYTGTHDNDTLQGWLENCSPELLLLVAEYIEGKKLASEKTAAIEKAKQLMKTGALRKDMIKTAIASSAVYAVIPMQDIIGIDNEGRMNTPSTTGSNWSWRMKKTDLKEKACEELALISNLYGRNLD